MVKSCGGCKHWLKLKNDGNKKSGICERHDGRSSSDHVCSEWKGIPFKDKLKYKREPELID